VLGIKLDIVQFSVCVRELCVHARMERAMGAT